MVRLRQLSMTTPATPFAIPMPRCRATPGAYRADLARLPAFLMTPIADSRICLNCSRLLAHHRPPAPPPALASAPVARPRLLPRVAPALPSADEPPPTRRRRSPMPVLSSTRAAGAGGSSSTMLRLYTDESPGLKVDPVVVLVLSLVFIFSVVALHIIAKMTRRFSS
ncbi:hypothetical protein PG991_015686 [Apiospora marii]|uniref:Protein transport protein Sec61 subunit beta n=1 Tax=Apiospora marii TaxID=335849 RepID=A0ABR1R2C0_9PEZI